MKNCPLSTDHTTVWQNHLSAIGWKDYSNPNCVYNPTLCFTLTKTNMLKTSKFCVLFIVAV